MAIPAAIFAAVIYVMHRELAALHPSDVLRKFRRIPSHDLVLATLLTVTSYWLLSFYDVLALRYLGRTVNYARVLMTSFVSYALGHNLGLSAFTGAAVRYRLYGSYKLGVADVATIATFCSVTSTIGFSVLTGASLALEPGETASLLHANVTLVRWIGAVLLLVILCYLGWAGNRAHAIRIGEFELKAPGGGLAVGQLLLAVLDLTAAAAVLWTLLPDSADVDFVHFAGTYAVACVAGIASHVPGGLGVLESVIVLALPQVRLDALLGSLLAYRIIYYLLPLGVATLVFTTREVATYRVQIAFAESAISAYITPIVPQIVGTLVFIAGAILLVSGATPAVDTRLQSLKDLMPLSILELSHLANSLVGVALLVLARALFRRVRAAYALTAWLLAAGIVASLLKGLDFEEAAFLAISLSVLWAGRRAFYRPSSLLRERFTAGWAISLIAIIAVATWVGFLAHRDVAYSNDLWCTFAFDGDAPRMLRASLIASVVLAAFLARNLLQSRHPAQEPNSPEDLQRARTAIAHAQFSFAQVALAGDKRLLFSGSGNSFLMYQVTGRSWVALGDPVGERDEEEELVWRFRDLSDREGGWTVFYQVRGERLPMYVDLGLTPLKVGEEARVPLASFTLQGSQAADLRHERRRAERAGATFEVIAGAELIRLMPQLRKISDAWLAEKNAGEKGFSVGAFSEEYLVNFPVAVVRAEGTPVAFANIWTSAHAEELSVDLMRFGPAAMRGAMDFLLIELMLWAKEQGYSWFNLGMAPLSGLHAGRLAPAWHRLGNFLYRHGEYFYNFEGLRRYKAKFHPVWDPRYLCSPGGLALPRILGDISVLIAGGVKELISK